MKPTGEYEYEYEYEYERRPSASLAPSVCRREIGHVSLSGGHVNEATYR
jgi:hypothetical protein